MDKDKKLFETGDFVEIEEIKKDKPNKNNDEPNDKGDEPDNNDESDDDSQDNSNDTDVLSSVFKWNGCIKQGYWLFQNGKKRKVKIKVNIAENHPFLKGKKLDDSDDTPPFSIRFNKKDASKQEEDNTFYFDQDNTNFEINPFGDWPDNTS